MDISVGKLSPVITFSIELVSLSITKARPFLVFHLPKLRKNGLDSIDDQAFSELNPKVVVILVSAQGFPLMWVILKIGRNYIRVEIGSRRVTQESPRYSWSGELHKFIYRIWHSQLKATKKATCDSSLDLLNI